MNHTNQSQQTPIVLTDQMRKAIAGAFAEIDRQQLRLLKSKTIAERVQMAASMIEAAETVSAYRLRQRQPELSEDEALRIVRGGLTNYLRQQRRVKEDSSEQSRAND